MEDKELIEKSKAALRDPYLFRDEAAFDDEGNPIEDEAYEAQTQLIDQALANHQEAEVAKLLGQPLIHNVPGSASLSMAWLLKAKPTPAVLLDQAYLLLSKEHKAQLLAHWKEGKKEADSWLTLTDDPSQAYRALVKASLLADDPKAIYLVSVSKALGLGTAKDEAKAIQGFRAIQSVFPSANWYLYQDQIQQPNPDWNQAAHWLLAYCRPKAESDYQDLDLGSTTHYLFGFPAEDSQKAQAIQALESQGDAYSLLAAALCYLNGDGCATDIQKAIRLLSVPGIHADIPFAQYVLAYAILIQDPKESDSKAAIDQLTAYLANR